MIEKNFYQKPKICHVIWRSSIGGMEKYVLNLLKIMKNLADVSLIHLGSPGILWEEYKKLGIPIYCFNIRHGLDIKNFIKLYYFFKNKKFDIIHSHIHTWIFNLILSFKKNNSKLIFTEHGGELLGKKLRDVLFYKFFASNYDLLIAISHYMKNIMIKYNPTLEPKIKVIYNGIPFSSKNLKKIDPKVYRKKLLPHLDLKEKVIGIVGRLVPQKGIDKFLYIASEIFKKRKDISFLVVGDGVLKEDLLKLSKKLGIYNDVHFLGFKKNVLEIMKCFDIFLLTSNWEPFGLVIIESMSVGVPVVALHCRGAVEELIKNDETGLIIKENNYFKIAEKILQFLDNKEKQKFIIENAYYWAIKNFSIESNVQKLMKIYRELLKS